MNIKFLLKRSLSPYSRLIEVLSFETLLTGTKRPNGGDIILLRTVGITAWLYVLALMLKQGLDPDRTWEFSQRELLIELRGTLPWIGAIFAAVYASLYARFSSQWLYLAGLYNQIKAIEARTTGPVSGETPRIIAEWKAGFLEDAQELHLATKRLFISIIKIWGEDPAVREEFIRNTPGGEERFNDLMNDVQNTYTLHAETRLRRLRLSGRSEKAATQEP